MTKQNESNEINELREKHTAAVEYYQKLNVTLAKVTGKVEKLESDMSRSVSLVKDLEKEHRAAEKEFLRENITRQELDAIAKKQKNSVKVLSESERALCVGKQVINEVNHDIRTSVEKMNITRQRLSTALRNEMIAQLPEDLNDKLLQIHATYPDKRWESMLFDVFPEPHPEKVKQAQAEFNKGLK